MAVIWTKTIGDDRYEVRNAGNSIRLYKNRVFHSQWNPTRPLSNGVWDLLFLPALFLPMGSVKRVLILGVGGGAVINQYVHLLSPQEIVGVELDEQHLSIAQRFFSLSHRSATLHCADATEWIRRYRGPAFDVIVEDLFIERDGEPERVMPMDEHWFSTLLQHLSRDGVLVVNFEDPGQMRRSSEAYLAVLDGREDIRYQFSQPSYGNCVCAFLKSPSTPAILRKQLADVLLKVPASRVSGQRFRVRRVS